MNFSIDKPGRFSVSTCLGEFQQGLREAGYAELGAPAIQALLPVSHLQGLYSEHHKGHTSIRQYDVHRMRQYDNIIPE